MKEKQIKKSKYRRECARELGKKISALMDKLLMEAMNEKQS